LKIRIFVSDNADLKKLFNETVANQRTNDLFATRMLKITPVDNPFGPKWRFPVSLRH